MGTVVEAIDLTHYYGKKLVYENLNFKIKKGSIFGLLGKNGTGKTTTINILNGYLRPKSGRCLMLGEDSYNLSPETKSRVGFLIEGHIQYQFMNVVQIEKFYRRFYPRWKRAPYFELMSKMAISESQQISKMSCGQRSQVALGLILAQDPDLLILDDYSMGLDAGYRRLFLDYLDEYARSEGKTIFVTSHIIQDLEDFLDDCVIMGYNEVLVDMPLREFRETFKRYDFEHDASPETPLKKSDVVRNYEWLKTRGVVYSFAERAAVEKALAESGANPRNVREVPMSLEDAFIGVTGKY
jgi:ABC-2 type transport system ATP-binding protein